MTLLLLLAACNGGTSGKDSTPQPDNDSGTPPGDSGTTGDSDPNTGDSGDSDEPVPGDVEGPDLPDCTAQAGSGDQVALSGVVLAPEGPIAGYVVYNRSSGLVECVGASCDVSSATVVCTEGIISPGLIDPHNHLQYNHLPPWQVDPEFYSRYDWQDDGRYYDYRTAYDEISDGYNCEIMKWAEARELVHGTTSAVGSYGDEDCLKPLLRNLDEDEDVHELPDYDLNYSSSNVTYLDEGDCGDDAEDLADGSTDAVLNHVAEGRDGAVRSEIDHMFSNGCEGPGQVYVHATDASTTQLARMGVMGTGIVWSPRSNLALYGTTTPVELAQTFGAPWAIGPDWTPSGSMAPVQEAACAADWFASRGSPLSDVQLWEKITTDAARIVGLDGVVGTLVAGTRADIAVFNWDRYPYRAVINAEATEVRLVVVEGAARYGLSSLTPDLAANSAWCEDYTLCAETRSICLKLADGDQSLADIEASLTAALAAVSMPSGYEYAGELYPLSDCGEVSFSCDLSAPTTGDEDGDGIADDSDVCAGLYDPDQWDTDGDGIGDFCDDCPIMPGTTCSTSADDIDGDGYPNESDNCPYMGNSDQTDTDGDGTGDACDAQELTIPDLQDETDPDYPGENAAVALSGIVVTAIRDGYGFFAQDPSATTYAGIWVYDGGGNDVSVGDVVNLTGTYVEYYGLAEIEPDWLEVTSSTTAPEPVLIADPCSIATGGADAESYESMLVAVEDVTITNLNPDGSSDYDEIEVAGCLRIDDQIYTDFDQPTATLTYARIQGVLIYSYSNYKLEPRDAADITE